MQFGLSSVWKQIFRSPTREILCENVKKTPLHYQSVNRKSIFFWHLPFV